ncbi:efflux RND transporter periplasmic adaptor subunit [Maricaulis sp. D1M11]|uniref:efflux RND transporter periplasmic adaptor subunit n=1 Tax=Maricaulis sp. D1M11 TaxID=3076117 RepID=UPI0039B55B65
MKALIGRVIAIGVPVGIIVGGVLMIGVMGSMRPEPEPAEQGPEGVAVFTTTARSEPVSLSVTTNGEVRPLTEINLVPQVSGRITYVNPNFIEGGFFEAGETLIRIEDADYRLAVTRASAQVAQAEQALLREQAESELAREEWDELGEGEASALTLREPQMAEARAQLAAARASLQSARLDLQRTQVSAPFAGRVRTKNADLGQFVTTGATLGQVFSTDRVEIRLPLADHELALLNLPLAYAADSAETALPVTLSATVAGTQYNWEGRLMRTDSSIDPRTRVLSAIAVVDDPYGVGADRGMPLAVGLFVDASIDGTQVDNAIVLPRSALRGTSDVYVMGDDNRLEIRPVDVITSDTDRVIISGGVSRGEEIITSAVRAASDGILVRAVNLVAEGESETGSQDAQLASAAE